MLGLERIRPVLALPLLGAHVWQGPFAYADPPDALWLGGYFDDADCDDVVLLLVMAMRGVVDTRPVCETPIRSGGVVEGIPEPPIPPSAPAAAPPSALHPPLKPAPAFRNTERHARARSRADGAAPWPAGSGLRRHPGKAIADRSLGWLWGAL